MSANETSPAPRPDIFNRNVRRLRRSRMVHLRKTGGDNFLNVHLAEDVAERFDDINLPIETILLIGAHLPQLTERLAQKASVTIVEPAPDLAAQCGAINADEDALLNTDALRGEKFDAIVWPGGLESVNDIPGALIQCRHLLKPGGVLIGGFVGGGSLATLKSVLLQAESERPVARMHPQIDLRSLGDLLLRCGFALPVADSHDITVRYSSLKRLVQDLREAGLTNVLAGETPSLQRRALDKLNAMFQAQSDPDGKTPEHFQFILFSAWVPDQPAPKPPEQRGQNLKV